LGTQASQQFGQGISNSQVNYATGLVTITLFTAPTAALPITANYSSGFQGSTSQFDISGNQFISSTQGDIGCISCRNGTVTGNVSTESYQFGFFHCEPNNNTQWCNSITITANDQWTPVGAALVSLTSQVGNLGYINTNCSNISITANTSIGGNLFLTRCSHVTVQGNVLKNSNSANAALIELTDSDFSGNVIHGFYWGGTATGFPGALAQAIRVDNQLVANQTGWPAGTARNTLRGNHVSNFPGDGIFLVGSSDNIVTDDQITDMQCSAATPTANCARGLAIGSGTTAPSSNNLVDNIRINDDQATPTLRTGFAVSTGGAAMAGNSFSNIHVSNAISAAYNVTGDTGTQWGPSVDFMGTTGTIGTASIGAGACTSGTVTIPGAPATKTWAATPATYPGDGLVWIAYRNAANTVTVKLCNVTAAAQTPAGGGSTYTVQ
jgi:parallel beta-helix repeat protein